MPIEVRNLPVVLAKVQTFEQKALAACARGMARGLDYIVSVAQRSYLQGPRPAYLGERSTRLRQSITRKVTITADGVLGRVGTNVKYAAIHEFGFHGIEHVKAHTRVVSQTSGLGIRTDTRRPIHDKEGHFVGFKDSRKASASRQKTGFAEVQFVKAHNRNMLMPRRPFIGPAVEKGTPILIREINAELQALAQAPA